MSGVFWRRILKFNIIVCFLLLSAAGCTGYDDTAVEAIADVTEAAGSDAAVTEDALAGEETSVDADAVADAGDQTVSEQDGESREDEEQQADTAAGTTAAREYTAEIYLKKMTVREKAAQMIFFHYNGETSEQLAEASVGGIILFADFFQGKDKAEVADAIQEMQNAAGIPMLVGVDEEGGTVVRVSKYSALAENRFASPQELYSQGGMEAVLEDTRDKSRLLLSLGINVNLAPVADVSTSASDYIYERTFGKDADETAGYVETVVSEMKEQGIGSVLKHFPGYGNNTDTHKGFAYDNRSYSDFETGDFLPFQAGIAAGADSVLVSHNIVACMDDTLPASLSEKVHNILRETMGFQGVIMTDDLDMDAISEADFGESPAVLAVLAGNDMIITADDRQHIEDILQAVEAGTITEDMLDAAVKRVLLWKLSLGLLETEEPPE